MKDMLSYLKLFVHDVPLPPKLYTCKDMEMFEISCCGTTFQVRRFYPLSKLSPNYSSSEELPTLCRSIVDVKGYNKYKIDELMASHPKSVRRDLMGLSTDISDLDDLLTHLIRSRPSCRVYPMLHNNRTTAFSIEHDGMSFMVTNRKT
jgi:hypothetical protein